MRAKGISDEGMKRLAKAVSAQEDSNFKTELYGGAYAFLDTFLNDEFKALEEQGTTEGTRSWVWQMMSDLERMGQLGQNILALYMTEFSKYLNKKREQ